MEKDILRLIQDDIKLSRLISTLETLNISAYYYYPANSAVILSLMGIEGNEDVRQEYTDRVEQACEKSFDEVHRSAKEVYGFLLTCDV